jgi:hypothetical protein
MPRNAHTHANQVPQRAEENLTHQTLEKLTRPLEAPVLSIEIFQLPPHGDVRLLLQRTPHAIAAITGDSIHSKKLSNSNAWQSQKTFTIFQICMENSTVETARILVHSHHAGVWKNLLSRPP